MEKENLKIKGVYKHFKNNYYILEDVATHSETGEKYAVYRQLVHPAGHQDYPADRRRGYKRKRLPVRGPFALSSRSL